MTSTSTIMMVAGFALLGLGKISPKAAKAGNAGMKSFVTAKALVTTGLPYAESRLLYEHGIPLASKRIGQTTNNLYKKAVPKEYQGKIFPAGVKSTGNALLSLSGAHCDVSGALHYLQSVLQRAAKAAVKPRVKTPAQKSLK